MKFLKKLNAYQQKKNVNTFNKYWNLLEDNT